MDHASRLTIIAIADKARAFGLTEDCAASFMDLAQALMNSGLTSTLAYARVSRMIRACRESAHTARQMAAA